MPPARHAVPGVGIATVDAAGSVAITELSGGPGGELALQRAWADPLAQAAAGRSLLAAVVLVDPAREAALAVTGEPGAAGRLAVGLADEGWLLLADRPAPLTWDAGGPVAPPRAAPLLVRRADVGSWDATPARPGSTAWAVDLPRATGPTPLAALVHVGRRGPYGPLAGHRRFERAATVVVGGVLAASGLAFDEHARLAALPALASDGSVPDLLAWWRAG
jgi:hypothetical protein